MYFYVGIRVTEQRCVGAKKDTWVALYVFFVVYVYLGGPGWHFVCIFMWYRYIWGVLGATLYAFLHGYPRNRAKMRRCGERHVGRFVCFFRGICIFGGSWVAFSMLFYMVLVYLGNPGCHFVCIFTWVSA